MTRQERDDARRAETRSKIQLGGLVVKAGLGEEDAAFVLGALIYAAEMKDDPKLRARMVKRGSDALVERTI